MTSGGRNFLDIPTAKVLWTAFIAIVVFMALGGLLYHLADKAPKIMSLKSEIALSRAR